MRRRRIEDLADRAEPGIEEMVAHRGKPRQRRLGTAVDAVFRQGVMSEEPGPYRALMIGGVAMQRITGVIRLVLGVLRRQRTQPVGGQQKSTAQRHDLRLSLWREGAVRQAHRKDLV